MRCLDELIQKALWTCVQFTFSEYINTPWFDWLETISKKECSTSLPHQAFISNSTESIERLSMTKQFEVIWFTYVGYGACGIWLWKNSVTDEFEYCRCQISNSSALQNLETREQSLHSSELVWVGTGRSILSPTDNLRHCFFVWHVRKPIIKKQFNWFYC